MVKVNNVLNWLATNINNSYDFDDFYGVQCMDLINQVTTQFFGLNITQGCMYPAEVWNSSLPEGWNKVFESEPGDIFIMGESSISPNGHIGFIAEDNSHIYDQNGTSNNDPITYRNGWDNYYIGFIRPPYSNSDSQVKKLTVNVNGLRIRKKPSLNSEQIGIYNKGDSWTLSITNHFIISDGYVWTESPNGYCAVGKNTGKTEIDDFISVT